MDLSAFSDFNDDAKLWVYAFQTDLSDADKKIVSDLLNDFCTSWQSHGAQVKGVNLIYKDRFALVCGEEADGISGCSIDSSVRVFKELREKHGLNALDTMLIHFQDGEHIRSLTRLDFAKQCEMGAITPHTTVYNTNITRLGELRAGQFELKFADSWHADAFKLPV